MAKSATTRKRKSPQPRRTGASASKVLSSSFRDPLALSQEDASRDSDGETQPPPQSPAQDGQGGDVGALDFELAPNSLGSETASGPLSRALLPRTEPAEDYSAPMSPSRDDHLEEEIVPSSVESPERGRGWKETRKPLGTPPSEPESQEGSVRTSHKRKRSEELTVANPVVGFCRICWNHPNSRLDSTRLDRLQRRRVQYSSQESNKADENSLPEDTTFHFVQQKARNLLDSQSPPSPTMDSPPKPDPPTQSQSEKQASQSPTQSPALAAPTAGSPSRFEFGTAPAVRAADMAMGIEIVMRNFNTTMTENGKLKGKIAKLESDMKTVTTRHEKELASLRAAHDRELAQLRTSYEAAAKKHAEDIKKQDDLLAKAREAVAAVKANLARNMELADERGREIDQLGAQLAEMHAKEAVRKVESERIKEEMEQRCSVLEKEADELRQIVEELRADKSRVETEKQRAIADLARHRTAADGINDILRALKEGQNMSLETPLGKPGTDDPFALSEPASQEHRSSGGRITSPAERLVVPATVVKPRLSPKKGAQPRGRRKNKVDGDKVLVNDSDEVGEEERE